MAETRDPEAPHGYEEDGVTPRAPYGWKADGTPKLSRRGRTSTKKPGASAGPAAAQGRSAAAQKVRSQRENLLALADAIISPAMAGASSAAFAAKVGQRRADGIAGSLVIVDGFIPAYVDQAVTMAQSKPALLQWMDTMEDKAPWLALGLITAQALKHVAANMANPDPRLAEAARLKVQVRSAQMAAAAEEEARKLGIPLHREPEPVHESAASWPQEPAAAGVPA